MKTKPSNQSAGSPKEGIVAGLKHAFAVEPPGPAQPTDRQREVVEKLCTGIVGRRLTVPTLAFLEMVRPLNYVGRKRCISLHRYCRW